LGGLCWLPKRLNVELYYFFYLVPKVTETKTVKISKETYAKLSEVAGELQTRLKRPVSLDEAMKYLISMRGKGRRITDLAGSWDISDAELAQIRASLTEAWKHWSPTEL